jgi:hypothetical protein
MIWTVTLQGSGQYSRGNFDFALVFVTIDEGLNGPAGVVG